MLYILYADDLFLPFHEKLNCNGNSYGYQSVDLYVGQMT